MPVGREIDGADESGCEEKAEGESGPKGHQEGSRAKKHVGPDEVRLLAFACRATYDSSKTDDCIRPDSPLQETGGRTSRNCGAAERRADFGPTLRPPPHPLAPGGAS